MAYKRTDRVNALLHHELQQLIQFELKDPRIGFATVTGVETTPDLRRARVFVSVLGSAEEGDASVSALDEARAYLRHELAARTELRYVPELSFRRDASIEQATRISALLRETTQPPRDRPDSDASNPPAEGGGRAGALGKEGKGE